MVCRAEEVFEINVCEGVGEFVVMCGGSGKLHGMLRKCYGVF